MIFRMAISLPAVAFLVLMATNESGLAASCSFPLAQPAGVSCDGLTINFGQSGSIANSGNIINNTETPVVDNFGTITTLTNSNTGVISGWSDGFVNENTGVATSIYNNGMFRGVLGVGIINLSNTSAQFRINNDVNGTIYGINYGISLGTTNVTTITNAGEITSGGEAIRNYGVGSVDIFNSGRIASPAFTIGNSGTINLIYNSGQICCNESIANGGTINNIINSGNMAGIIENSGSIGSITNIGSINSQGFIRNYGSINVINNSQGASNQYGVLNYDGILPKYYNIIITPNGYGQLNIGNKFGVTSFGVFGGDPAYNIPASTPQAKTRYMAVLSGVDATNLTSLVGSYNGLPWKLALESGSQTIWDLVFGPFAPSATNTTLALAPNRDSVRNALHLRFATLAAVTDYDCSTFDKLGFCISFQARYTATTGANDGAGVLIAAYRLTDRVRIGGFIDYRVTQGNAVGLRYGQDTPTFGGFIAYNQNNDGTGFQAKITAGYNSTGVTVTRTPLDDAEPGSGATSLRSFVLGGQVAWGLAIDNSTVIAPYAGLRYINTTRNAYSENFNPLVQYPVFYNPYFERVTTASAGARLNGMLTTRIGYQAAVGAEYDLWQSANTYSGTSAIPGLETWAIGHGGGPNRFRPVASVGLSYAVAPNQNLIANVGVRGQSFSSSVALTTLAGYRVSF